MAKKRTKKRTSKKKTELDYKMVLVAALGIFAVTQFVTGYLEYSNTGSNVAMAGVVGSAILMLLALITWLQGQG